MKRGATPDSEQKFKKAREDAVQTYACQPHVLLVDNMLELEELFRLSMSEHNELSEYLEQNPAHLFIMNKISKDLQVVMDNEMDEFIIALDHMVNSKGYSMIKFLESEPDAVEFLQKQMLQLEKVYFGLLLYRKSKLLAELGVLESDADESSNDSSEFEKEADYLPSSHILSTVSVDESEDDTPNYKKLRASV